MVISSECDLEFHRKENIQVIDKERTNNRYSKGFDIIKIESLPIGFMAAHQFVKYFKAFLELIEYLRSQNLFVVEMKR